MATVFRTVSGILKNSNEELMLNTPITVEALDFFGEGGIDVPSKPKTYYSDEITGAYSFKLATSDTADSFVRYKIAVGPSGNKDVFRADVIAGSATSLGALKALGVAAAVSEAAALAALLTFSNLTTGSIVYKGPSGLAENNDAIFFDAATNALRLLDRDYNFSAGGWNGLSSLQIGNNNSPILENTLGVYGAKIDLYRSQTSGSFTQTSGFRVRAQNAATGGTGNNMTTGVESFVRNNADTTGNSSMQAVEGIAQSESNAAVVYGGYFSAGTSSGGVGTAVTSLIGSHSRVQSFNQFAVTNAVVFDGSAFLTNGPTTNLYGLRLHSWTGSAVTNSYGIYADTSIDRGTTSKYFIYSLSTSPSLFSGKISSTGGVSNFSMGANVASAAAIAPTGNMFHVTGTTNITSITATALVAGTYIRIIFDDVLTFTNGNNLKLAGDFVTSANATITLGYDGTNFYEMGRSVNT